MTKMALIIISTQMMFYKNHMMILIMTISMALISSMKMFMISLNYWASFLIILIFISGIMVLFMFIISLSPNEKFLLKNTKTIMMFIIIFNFLLLFMNIKNNFSYNSKMNSSYKNNLFITNTMILLITITSMIPPKMSMEIYKGMKTSK